jgi:rhodanese-related sulfurtransferase
LEFQTARLDDALLMPMGDVTSRAHAELDPDAHIVVLCHHGQRSLSVAMWLRGQGFERAQSLAGGIDAWSRTIDPTVPRY